MTEWSRHPPRVRWAGWNHDRVTDIVIEIEWVDQVRKQMLAAATE